MKLYRCEHCSTWIPLSFIKGYTHVTCPTCSKKYQLDTSSLRKYMFIPLLCVIFTVYTSLLLLDGNSILLKFIYIIGVSFLLSGLLGWLALRVGWFHYEEKKSG